MSESIAQARTLGISPVKKGVLLLAALASTGSFVAYLVWKRIACQSEDPQGEAKESEEGIDCAADEPKQGGGGMGQAVGGFTVLEDEDRNAPQVYRGYQANGHEPGVITNQAQLKTSTGTGAKDNEWHIVINPQLEDQPLLITAGGTQAVSKLAISPDQQSSTESPMSGVNPPPVEMPDRYLPPPPQEKLTLMRSMKGFSARDYHDTLSATLADVYSTARVLTAAEARALVQILELRDSQLLLKALTAMSNLAAFTSNQDLLRDHGAINQLVTLVTEGPDSSLSTSETVMMLQCISNMAVNSNNQKLLQSAIKPLVDMLSQPEGSELIKLTSFRALINLTLEIQPQTIPNVVPLIPLAFHRLSTEDDSWCVLALKLLVNLSCHPDVIDHLLAAKAPDCLLSLYETSRSEDVLLRSLALLWNLANHVETLGLALADLSSYLAETNTVPAESVYAILFETSSRPRLKHKLANLSSHGNLEISQKARRLNVLCQLA